MTNYVLQAETGHINLSPVGFRRWATHYLKAARDFEAPDEGFSPVRYFLLCRAIELQLKAWHLENRRQKEVKINYGHNLIVSYEDLSADKQMLSAEEVDTLRIANTMYMNKGFEYMSVMDAGTGFSRAPCIGALERIAIKLIGDDG